MIVVFIVVMVVDDTVAVVTVGLVVFVTVGPDGFGGSVMD